MKVLRKRGRNYNFRLVLPVLMILAAAFMASSIGDVFGGNGITGEATMQPQGGTGQQTSTPTNDIIDRIFELEDNIIMEEEEVEDMKKKLPYLAGEDKEDMEKRIKEVEENIASNKRKRDLLIDILKGAIQENKQPTMIQ